MYYQQEANEYNLVWDLTWPQGRFMADHNLIKFVIL